ncbi:hypothetical protein PUNSTDRAFT_130517 [Punctularia strigosozonata HHB-11173 SS5]|uniref:uncharacterized protein n=1 Tax=Punctularia strigosozonata (strain HHB-11173) TaxID=741275 RepID=UPI0004417D6F|nr:uncharacterized protein PUNSTDRAFT_130517 [Punctularia strigosozonata HHB-11173 SS5]EIN12251.1 hypothetical protein PUNSTDRAFT_130517 [Punctularia strigosozonata HHB-11173 SS5]
MFGTSPQTYLEYLLASVGFGVGFEGDMEPVVERFQELYKKWSGEDANLDENTVPSMDMLFKRPTTDDRARFMPASGNDPSPGHTWEVANPFIFFWDVRGIEAEEVRLWLEKPEQHLRKGATLSIASHIMNYERLHELRGMGAREYLCHVFANGGLSDHLFEDLSYWNQLASTFRYLCGKWRNGGFCDQDT